MVIPKIAREGVLGAFLAQYIVFLGGEHGLPFAVGFGQFDQFARIIEDGWNYGCRCRCCRGTGSGCGTSRSAAGLLFWGACKDAQNEE